MQNKNQSKDLSINQIMTTATQDQNIARYRTLFDTYEQQLNGQRKHPIHQLRKTAAAQLEQLRFPTRRDEDYKYTSFARVLNQDYVFPSNVEVDASSIENHFLADSKIHLVFINGIYKESLSNTDNLPEGLSITSIAKGLEQEAFKPFIEKHLQENASSENPFVVLNTTFAQGGVFIHVKKNAIIEEPIQILQYNSNTEQAFIQHPLRLIEAERGSQLSIVDTHFGEAGANYFSNVVNVFHVHANAHVAHYKLQTESKSAYQINNTVAYQEQDSTYTNLALDLGGRIIRNNLSTIHQGQNITSNLYGAFMGDEDQHIDHQTFIDHAIPHCQSNELYKGVLDGKAHGVFNGKVMVRKDAQKTNAYQQNAALVLSEKAVMDSKPQLEIYADDVKCSHGATIGQLDQTSMFYLRARGMSEQTAKQTLQYAFLIEVLEELDNEAIQEKAEELIYNKFNK